MGISPFSVRPAPTGSERRRARLVMVIASVGITATLLAYAFSPGVRHAVSHAEHSVKHAVSHVFAHPRPSTNAHHRRAHLVRPLVPGHGGPLGAGHHPRKGSSTTKLTSTGTGG